MVDEGGADGLKGQQIQPFKFQLLWRRRKWLHRRLLSPAASPSSREIRPGADLHPRRAVPAGRPHSDGGANPAYHRQTPAVRRPLKGKTFYWFKTIRLVSDKAEAESFSILAGLSATLRRNQAHRRPPPRYPATIVHTDLYILHSDLLSVLPACAASCRSRFVSATTVRQRLLHRSAAEWAIAGTPKDRNDPK
ncbi:hypothetical protein KSP39_PZI018433 [Platanthera zijinensis]|uniref:Uncharacterized protein n=1 Tax=Platanthera zijinensis TaxID=2320716 RepID=A0AAP0FYI7_9ASPA